MKSNKLILSVVSAVAGFGLVTVNAAPPVREIQKSPAREMKEFKPAEGTLGRAIKDKTGGNMREMSVKGALNSSVTTNVGSDAAGANRSSLSTMTPVDAQTSGFKIPTELMLTKQLGNGPEACPASLGKPSVASVAVEAAQESVLTGEIQTLIASSNQTIVGESAINAEGQITFLSDAPAAAKLVVANFYRGGGAELLQGGMVMTKAIKQSKGSTSEITLADGSVISFPVELSKLFDQRFDDPATKENEANAVKGEFCQRCMEGATGIKCSVRKAA